MNLRANSGAGAVIWLALVVVGGAAGAGRLLDRAGNAIEMRWFGLVRA